MRLVTFVAASSLAFLAAARAAEQNAIVGVWKLTSYERKMLDTGKVERTLGENPVGYLIYTAGGHMSAVAFGADRKTAAANAPTAAEALAWFQTTIAGYAGTYRVRGNDVVHHVEAAWTPAWVGTDQLRHFKIDGHQLTIETAPSRSVLDGKSSIRYLKFDRIE